MFGRHIAGLLLLKLLLLVALWAVLVRPAPRATVDVERMAMRVGATARADGADAAEPRGATLPRQHPPQRPPQRPEQRP